MQATRIMIETGEAAATSGTFEAAPASHIDEAHRLATEVERLLTPARADADRNAAEPYDVRITRALARSLIDALADMKRGPKRARPV